VSGASSGWTELLAAAESIRARAIEREPATSQTVIAAVGWATVDADRACRELDALLDGEHTAWQPVDREATLGARALRREPPPGPGGGVDLLVLEPDTEGRLAASLARFGEGVAVAYLRQPAAAAGAVPAARARLVPGAPAWGPHAVVLGDQ